MRRAWQLALAAAWLAGSAAAHELDHYNLPSGTRFADLGPYLTATAHEHIASAVARLNAQMARAGGAELERLRSPDALAEAVCLEFPPVVDYIGGMERQFHDPAFTAGYAGLIVAFRSSPCIYEGAPLPIEPRAFFLLWRSSLVRVNGVFLGTDKIGHFVHNGHNYYLAYRAALRESGDADRAMAEAVRVGVDGNFFFSERGLLGAYTSSVISNADLAANYLGLLFYLNLTQDVQLRGGTTQPRLVNLDREWRIAPHVRRDGDFFVRFFSDHMDEVLNPNIYEQRMHDVVKPRVAAQCARIRAWYAQADGTLRPRAWFEQQQRELSTYFGAEYGFIRDAPAGFISIATECFGAGVESALANAAANADPLRRTALMRAVRSGDVGRVRAALPGAAVNAVDLDGETALHHAARRQDAEMARALLEAGARGDLANRYGNTPLHVAAAHGATDVAVALLRAGAPVDNANAFGATPLHAAAEAGHVSCVARLMESGAALTAVDAAGKTPLQYATRSGRREVAACLGAAGADRPIANRGSRAAQGVSMEARVAPRSGDPVGSSRMEPAAQAGGATERRP